MGDIPYSWNYITTVGSICVVWATFYCKRKSSCLIYDCCMNWPTVWSWLKVPYILIITLVENTKLVYEKETVLYMFSPFYVYLLKPSLILLKHILSFVTTVYVIKADLIIFCLPCHLPLILHLQMTPTPATPHSPLWHLAFPFSSYVLPKLLC